MFQRFGSWIRGFMAGRNGVDRLAWVLCILGIVINLIGSFTGLAIFTILAYIPLILAFWRIFSRNLAKRQAENEAFLQFFARIRGRRYYHYFRCPDCRTRVRVPRKKGKLRITCPSCHSSFIRKT